MLGGAVKAVSPVRKAESFALWMLKPLSLAELSFQVNATRKGPEAGVAARFEGTGGATSRMIGRIDRKSVV